MNPQMIRKKIREYLELEEKKLIALRDEMNSYIGGLQAKSIAERRDFYKNFSVVVAALLGLNPILITTEVETIGYFYTSTIFYIILLILILGHLRETYDREDYGLTFQKNNYNLVIYQALDLVKDYKKKDLTVENGESYDRDKKKIPGLSGLDKEVNEVREGWKSKMIANIYVGELFMFLFILAVIFMGLSLSLENYLATKFIFLIIIFAYLISILNFTGFIIKIFSWLPSQLKELVNFNGEKKKEKKMPPKKINL